MVFRATHCSYLHEALFETGSKSGSIPPPFAFFEASGAFAFACQPYLVEALPLEWAGYLGLSLSELKEGPCGVLNVLVLAIT